MKNEVKWKNAATKKDIGAAREYLTLVFTPQDIASATAKLTKHSRKIERFKAKDILRASKSQLLPETNEDVRAEFLKILAKEAFAPIILVRKNEQLFIADGYHRTCACYYLNKECEVDAVLVGIE